MITMLGAVKTVSLILLALCFGIQLDQLLISPLQQLMKVMKTLKELEKIEGPQWIWTLVSRKYSRVLVPSQL